MTAAPWFNPFDDAELASGYEAWYETDWTYNQGQ